MSLNTDDPDLLLNLLKACLLSSGTLTVSGRTLEWLEEREIEIQKAPDNRAYTLSLARGEDVNRDRQIT